MVWQLLYFRLYCIYFMLLQTFFSAVRRIFEELWWLLFHEFAINGNWSFKKDSKKAMRIVHYFLGLLKPYDSLVLGKYQNLSHYSLENLSFCPSIHERRSDVWYVHKLLFWVESLIRLSSTLTHLQCLKASYRERLGMHKVYLSIFVKLVWYFCGAAYTLKLVCLSLSFHCNCMDKISRTISFCVPRRKNIIWVWNDTRAIKWWHNVNFFCLFFGGWTNPNKTCVKNKRPSARSANTCLHMCLVFSEHEISHQSEVQKSCLGMRERLG